MSQTKARSEAANATGTLESRGWDAPDVWVGGVREAKVLWVERVCVSATHSPRHTRTAPRGTS
eukprot:2938614-Rhodomonas_salina.2